MINYNDPLRLTCVFKDVGVEYGGEIAVRWEDIKIVEEYPFKEPWNKYPGEKYYIQLDSSAGAEQARIILGSYMSMITHWTNFRRQYPLFIEHGVDKNK